MKKLLIAIDDSASSMKAAEYVAEQFGGAGEIQVGLVHVLPNLPALFWDEGHILSEEEKRDRQKVVDTWLAGQMKKMVPKFNKAVEALTKTGVKPEQIQIKSISDSIDVADSIIEEARDGGYRTIIVGRCDRSAKHLLGSVSSRIVAQGAGLTVTIVE